MIEATRTREPLEAPLLDTGEVPGDHLGAAGFDSAFFAHLKVIRVFISLVKLLIHSQIMQRNWTYNKTTTMINRLELHVKKTGIESKTTKSLPMKTLNPVTAPGRLAGLRNNAVRFTQCTTQDGKNLTIPVTLECNVPNTTKGQKRKRDENKSTKPTVRWSKVARKTKGN